MEIKVLKNVMIKNNAVGNDNRKIFLENNVCTINITSSPGAGKTTLLETSLKILVEKYSTAVIEGDLYTSRDAERLEKYRIPLIQINTEGGCHLDAKMINHALKGLDLKNLDLVFIENVGNLVCPASFDLGEDLNILLFSITEGGDKPKKYATIFEKADAVLINKVDLTQPCRIDLDALEKEIHEVNPLSEVFRISALDIKTMENYLKWLKNKIDEKIKKN